MVKSKWIKEYRAGKRGQSLVEVAVFGSFLLLVLGFLVSQGLQYNYQQEVKMEAFRRALLMASESNAPKVHVVDVRKDVHFPDPSDMFALGQRSEIRSPAAIVWNNNSNQLSYADIENTPSAQYVFNPDSQLVDPVYRNYTTSALDPQGGEVFNDADAILNGVPDPYHIGSVDQTRVYQAIPDYGPKQVMVLMNTTIPDCTDAYCEKDIVGSVNYTADIGGTQYWPIHNVTRGDVGESPDEVAFRNDEAGQINETLGLEQVTNKIITKNRVLTLDENPSMRRSVERLRNQEFMQHVIVTRDGNDNQNFAFPDAEPLKTWVTPK